MRTSNIQHPTSNLEPGGNAASFFTSMFGARHKFASQEFPILSVGVLTEVEGSCRELQKSSARQRYIKFQTRSFDCGEYTYAQDQTFIRLPNGSRAPMLDIRFYPF